jgi:4-amino-4-deoxy-L-arabinose transferase-like glycosyltransferase
LLRFLGENRTPREELLLRARLPFLGVLAALLIAVYLEARRRFGMHAAFFALGLVAFHPNVIAHSSVVHTDLLLALWVVLSLWPLGDLRNPEKRWSAVLLGLFWGLAFLSKFSAPLVAISLLPLLLIPTSRNLEGTPSPASRGGGSAEGRGEGLFGLRWSPLPTDVDRSALGLGRIALRILLALPVAALVVLLGYGIAYRHQTPADREAVARQALLLKGRSPAALSAANSIGGVIPPAGHAFTGVAMVYLQSKIGVGGPVNFFMGRRSVEGSPFYFPVAIAVKITVGLAGALLLALSAKESRRFVLVFLAGFAIVLLASARTTYNIGVRHVLFFFPVAAIAASGVLAREASGAKKIMAAGLLGIAAMETLAAHPHHMSFFNVLAGGSEAGHRFFADSNVDWGQDLKRLAKRAPTLTGGAPLPAVVFAGELPASYFPALCPVAPGDEDRAGVLFAIGESPFAIGPEFLRAKGAIQDADRLERLRHALLTRGERVDSIGGSIGIWRIRTGASP